MTRGATTTNPLTLFAKYAATNAPWTGSRVTRARTWLANQTTWPTPCPRCHQPVHPTHWHLGHTIDRNDRPDLTWNPGNWRIEHPRCNTKAGAIKGNIQRGKLKSTKQKQNGTAPFFPGKSSVNPAANRNTHTRNAAAVNQDLSAFAGIPWVAPLIDRMPPTANLPRAMTGPHPRAVGSYGPAAVDWARTEMGIELRWFQQLAMVRQLEHDDAGALVWRSVLESTPRRVGKSVRLRCVCCWRVDHADLLGEPQTVLFTGKDLPICKEIHRAAWVWAKARGWTVRKGMGNEEIEAPDESRWLVRSQNGVYGYPAGLACCDESWAVPAAVINEGLQPALMDRPSPQLHLTSTAHTRATMLMVRRISDAMGSLDGSGRHLLLLWAAGDDADTADPAAWRAASPHWDAEREVLVGDAWDDVLTGQAVPDPLEPDPVAGFRAQYLNIWPSVKLVAPQPWGARLAGLLPPASEPGWSGLLVGAMESEQDGSLWGVAVSDGRHVECAEVGRRSDALAWLRARSPVSVLAHGAVIKQVPDAVDLVLEPVALQDAAAATAVLRDQVGGLSWSGPLVERLRAADVAVSVSGERLDASRSTGPVAVVKAASWALWGARAGLAQMFFSA